MGLEFRQATAADLAEIHAIHSASFEPDDPSAKPGGPRELEHGIALGEVVVVVVDGVVAGYQHSEHAVGNHAALGSLAVSPAHRGNQLGQKLIEHFLSVRNREAEPGKLTVAAVATPNNHQWLKMLLNCGFTVRRYSTDHFGDGQSRYVCQFNATTEPTDAASRCLIPTEAMSEVRRYLDQGYVINQLHELSTGPHFELSRLVQEDLATSLQVAEMGTGITSNPAILAATTFLLGFSLTSPGFPDAVRLLLVAGVVSSTLAQSIYASTSAELSRWRAVAFDARIRWGAVISELGGMYPFLIAIPVTLTNVSPSLTTPMSAATAVGIIIFLFGRSKLSPLTRFRPHGRSVSAHVLLMGVAVTPALGVLAVWTDTAIPTWTGATALLLALSAALYLLPPHPRPSVP